jgi:hypothetical protein
MTTRPVERLYIGNYFVEEKNFGGVFDESLRLIAPELGIKVQNNHFVFGEKKVQTNVDKDAKNNQFLPVHLNDRLWFPKISLIKDFSNEEFELSVAQRYGNQLHFLLSAINSINEIESILEKFTKENFIEKEFESRLKMDLISIFENHNYKNLLEDNISVLSEQKIISSNFETKVPDKIIYKKNEIIVVDFKTGLKSKKHIKQVSEYVRVLSQMELKSVKGYLFYTSNLELLQVAAS